MLGRTPNFGGWGWLGVGCLHLASSRVASSVARAETRRREVSRASMLSHRPPSSELTGPASEGRSWCSCSVPPFQKSTITTRKWQFEQSSEHETREHPLAGSTYLDTIPPTKALEDPCIDVQVIDALQGLDLALEAVLGAGSRAWSWKLASTRHPIHSRLDFPRQDLSQCQLQSSQIPKWVHPLHDWPGSDIRRCQTQRTPFSCKRTATSCKN